LSYCRILTRPQWARKLQVAKEISISAARKAGGFDLYKVAETATVAKVVKEFRAALQKAAFFVFDKILTDNTAQAARLAGAMVFHEAYQGKGSVVQRMFTDIEAGINARRFVKSFPVLSGGCEIETEPTSEERGRA
jgi:hypothetical protein